MKKELGNEMIKNQEVRSKKPKEKQKKKNEVEVKVKRMIITQAKWKQLKLKDAKKIKTQKLNAIRKNQEFEKRQYMQNLMKKKEERKSRLKTKEDKREKIQ